MFQNPFETQNGSTTVYDGAHEYCTAEHVDEEYFRASLKKRIRADKAHSGHLVDRDKGGGP